MTDTLVDGRTADPALLARLADAFGDRLATPAQIRWDETRTAWNTAVDQNPLAVVAVRDEADIAAAVRLAGDAGVPVHAQPRGHGAVAGLVDGAVVLRTALLDQVVLDTARRRLRVGAGANWGAALAALDGTGLVGPAGSSPDVTVAGLLLNGGLPWFGRAHGLSSHALHAVEFIGADGERRRVDADHDAEMFWAMRGGGGIAGVVTALEIDLTPVPSLSGGKILFPVSDAPAVLAAFSEVTADAPRELTVWASLLHLPDIPEIPEPMRGGSFAVLDWTALADTPDIADRMARLRSAGTVLADSSGPVEIGRLGEVAAEPLEPGPSVSDAAALARFTAADAEALLAVAGPGSLLTSVAIRHLGGALADPEPAPGAYGPVGALPDPYVVFALGSPSPLASAETLHGALADVLAALGPAASGGRLAPTFLHTRPSSEAYDPQTLARLRRIAADRDPRGVIRPARPI